MNVVLVKTTPLLISIGLHIFLAKHFLVQSLYPLYFISPCPNSKHYPR